MGGLTDWQSWHAAYSDPASPLSRRLRLVSAHIDRWLDGRPDEPLRVLSLCAGQGHDLLGVLAGRGDAHRVRATLVELDPRNAEAARATARQAALPGVDVLEADAGTPASFARTLPVDLLLLVGVLGNVTDADAERTVMAVPALCAPGATVIWTRSRRPPDLTPRIRQWLARAGCAEEAFHAPEGVLFSVGVHRLTGPRNARLPARLFTFVR